VPSRVNSLYSFGTRSRLSTSVHTSYDHCGNCTAAAAVPLEPLYVKSHLFSYSFQFSIFGPKLQECSPWSRSWCCSQTVNTLSDQPWNYFWRIPTYVITISERHRQTTCIALRGKNGPTKSLTKWNKNKNPAGRRKFWLAYIQSSLFQWHVYADVGLFSFSVHMCEIFHSLLLFVVRF